MKYLACMIFVSSLGLANAGDLTEAEFRRLIQSSNYKVYSIRVPDMIVRAATGYLPSKASQIAPILKDGFLDMLRREGPVNYNPHLIKREYEEIFNKEYGESGLHVIVPPNSDFELHRALLKYEIITDYSQVYFDGSWRLNPIFAENVTHNCRQTYDYRRECFVPIYRHKFGNVVGIIQDLGSRAEVLFNVSGYFPKCFFGKLYDDLEYLEYNGVALSKIFGFWSAGDFDFE